VPERKNLSHCYRLQMSVSMPTAHWPIASGHRPAVGEDGGIQVDTPHGAAGATRQRSGCPRDGAQAAGPNRQKSRHWHGLQPGFSRRRWRWPRGGPNPRSGADVASRRVLRPPRTGGPMETRPRRHFRASTSFVPTILTTWVTRVGSPFSSNAKGPRTLSYLIVRSASRILTRSRLPAFSMAMKASFAAS